MFYTNSAMSYLISYELFILSMNMRPDDDTLMYNKNIEEALYNANQKVIHQFPQMESYLTSEVVLDPLHNKKWQVV